MTSMLATETAEAAAKAPITETWVKNERMRHIPQVPWMTWKLDSDLRRRIDLLVAPYEALPGDDPHRGGIDEELRALCRAIDRVTDVARPARHAHPPHELRARITWGLNQAVTALHSLDADLIGRRFPFQTFERSKAEPLYGALLSVMQHVERLTTLVRAVAPGVDEQLLEGLVQLETPLRREPIA